MTDMNIAFCANNTYSDKVAVVMTSILENHKTQKINFYIFSSDLDDSNLHLLQKLLLKYKNFTVQRILVPQHLVSSLPLNISHISVETYYRYVIADLLPDLDKILYLDADLIVCKNIADFYSTDLKNNYFSGAEDLYIKEINHKQSIGLGADDLYINAGVLLMNLKLIRQDNLGEKLINATKELWNKIKYQDQDVINIVCKGKIKKINNMYNFATHNMLYNAKLIDTAKIIHYTGSKKPWLTGRGAKKVKFSNIWRKYAKITNSILQKQVKVGLIIDEFFGGAGTAFGGYGFLARNYIAKYIPNTDIKVDVLLGRGKHLLFAEKYHVDNVDLYKLPKSALAAQLWLKKQNYDVYLSIELTSNYILKNEKNSNKNLILWIQDPRPKYEWDEIETVKLFTETNYYNQKIYDLVHDWNEQGHVKFISQGYFLNQKAIDLYNLPADTPIQYLPNPIEIDKNFNVQTYPKKDNIIFLGRIESVKRGWLFCEIAKNMPEYNFYVLGQTFREKSKNESIMAKYQNIPNLHFAGHVDGEEKAKYLKDAKILVNTSIHEALPISFLEALSYGTCLVSNRNPENLTSKFGIWTGQINGDGFDKINLYINAIKTLMTDDKLRSQYAAQGRAYIEKVHNVNNFVRDLCRVIFDTVKL